LALREALSQTKPFVEVLFEREFALEPLDTPEKKAGFKKRLKALAAQIEDKDLAHAYRDDLLHRLDLRLAPQKPAYVQKQDFTPQARNAKSGFKGRHFEPPMVSTPEGIKAANALSLSLDRNCAALAQGVLDHPVWIDDQIEALESYGFGDDSLKDMVKNLLNLSFSSPTGLKGLDTEALNRHLQNQGLGTLLHGIQKAALLSGAPYLATDIPLERAHDLWLIAFNATARLTSLDRALFSAKSEASQHFDTEFFSRLKLERDSLRRALKSGEIWQETPQTTV